MKKSFIFFLSLIVFFTLSVQVNAQTTIATPGSRIKNNLQTGKLAQLQSRCQAATTVRIASLQNLTKRLTEIKRVSLQQKSLLTSQVQETISQLQILKTTCAQETDVTKLQQEVQSIYTQYRVFGILEPEIALLVAANRLQATIDVLTTQTENLEKRITEAEQKGETVTQQRTQLAQMRQYITQAIQQVQSITTVVSALKPADFPATAQFQQARTAWRNGKQQVGAAAELGKQIRKILIKSTPLSTTPVVR